MADPQPEMQLGRFVLEAPIGAGGMGEVWRARHVTEGVPAAVKLMTSGAARDPAFVESFRAEVRAIAALDHPGIVSLYDHGVVSTAEAVASRGRVLAGAPYLVMELAPHGTLADVDLPLPWSETRAVLRALLDALGYAHAHGIVHRDLKPGNVLLAPEPRLADFGLVHAHENVTSARTGENIQGTVHFMAPEQAQGLWRDFGPWTDLYALGCLCHALTTGAVPFADLVGLPALFAHLTQPVPPVPAGVDVPAGFAEWVGRLLEKDPYDRFRSAAEARGALDALEGEARAVEDWREARPPRPPHHLEGVGLSLFGLRTVPMVGREAEREALWRALRAVIDEGRARAVVVRGVGGAGRTRLVEWLGRRAHALLGAENLTARHEDIPGPDDGVTPLLRRALRCQRLERDPLLQRLQRLKGVRVAPGAVEVMASLLEPGANEAAETHAAARSALAWLARDRPVVLHVADAQWGPESLAFTRELLDVQPEVPLLLVLTVRDERVEDPAAIDALCERPEVEVLKVGPLPAADHARLVRELLGLDGALAARVEERTAGSPLFAVNLVGAWVRGGLLVPGRGGFRLAPGAEPEVPVDAEAHWGDTLEAVLGALDAPSREALERAAVLGVAPDLEEWAAVGAEPDALEPLLAAGLAQREARGRWRFAHVAVREALVRHAQRADRLSAHHRRCAQALNERGAEPHRVGRHLVAGDEAARALRPLLEGARQQLARGEYGQAALCLTERERALDAVAAEADHPLRADGWLLRARVARARGRLDEAEELLARIDAAMRPSTEWARLRAPTAELRGVLAYARGDEVAALKHLDEAEAAWRRNGDRRALAHCQSERAKVLLQTGAVNEAVDLLRTAHTAFVALGDARGEARCSLALALAARQLDELGDARAAIGMARAAFERAGSRSGVAECCNIAGELARVEGDLDQAEAHYREAIARYLALGEHTVDFARTNLGLVLLDQGRLDEAEALLAQCRARFERLGPRPMVGAVALVQAVCAAEGGEWARAASQLATASHILGDAGYCDVDLARLAERAGALAAVADQEALATAAFTLAADQLRRLGRDAEAEKLTP